MINVNVHGAFQADLYYNYYHMRKEEADNSVIHIILIFLIKFVRCLPKVMVEKQGYENSGNRKNFIDTEDPVILWKDRKRYLGMPISFTRYAVDQDRFTSRIGFFNTVTNETLLYRILDLKMTRSLWQKIFGVGTLTLFIADRTHSEFPLKNIKRPEKVRRFLSNLVEQERDKRRITGREMFGVADMDGMPDYDGDGMPG